MPLRKIDQYQTTKTNFSAVLFIQEKGISFLFSNICIFGKKLKPVILKEIINSTYFYTVISQEIK